jgi:hypothetical protein
MSELNICLQQMAFLLAIKKSQFNSPTHTHHWIITSGMARISVKIKVPRFFKNIFTCLD